MPFAYYKKLSPVQKRIYDQSDAVPNVVIPEPERFGPYLDIVRKALESGHRINTETETQRLVTIITRLFRVPGVRVRVLAERPSKNWGELHGLYEVRPGQHPTITVWMRTAKRSQVVAFRTFLRTLVHEVMHHFDYTLLKLADSFHTNGFYKRESGFLKQLLGEWDEKRVAAKPIPAPRKALSKASKTAQKP